jgi:hypothetical protein
MLFVNVIWENLGDYSNSVLMYEWYEVPKFHKFVDDHQKSVVFLIFGPHFHYKKCVD